MTAPGFVPRLDSSLVDRVASLEKLIRAMQQNIAGATTANGGVPLTAALPAAIGTSLVTGTAASSAHADHVHTSTLATQLDTAVSAPSAGQLLTYSGGAWRNAAPTLAADTDVAVSGPTAGQTLAYNGSAWANVTNTPVLAGSGLAGTLGTTVYTTSGSTELNLAKLAVSNVSVTNGHTYLFFLYAYSNPSAASADFWFRVRLNTALTGTELRRWTLVAPLAGFDAVPGYVAAWQSTVTGTVSLYVSAALMSGTGTLNVCAGSAFAVVEGGASSTWTWS